MAETERQSGGTSGDRANYISSPRLAELQVAGEGEAVEVGLAAFRRGRDPLEHAGGDAGAGAG